MGFLASYFLRKKHTAAVAEPQPQPQPVQMPEQPKPRYIVKSQRFILENTKEHMKDIMYLVDKNEDYRLREKDFIEEFRVDEKVFQYELNTPATINTISCGGVRRNYKYLYMIPILEI